MLDLLHHCLSTWRSLTPCAMIHWYLEISPCSILNWSSEYLYNRKHQSYKSGFNRLAYNNTRLNIKFYCMYCHLIVISTELKKYSSVFENYYKNSAKKLLTSSEQKVKFQHMSSLFHLISLIVIKVSNQISCQNHSFINCNHNGYWYKKNLGK